MLAQFLVTPSVLVVDDDCDARDIVALSLQGAGYEVRVAGDGRTALAMLRADPPPGAVLLDLMMPGVSGWEVLAELEASDRASRVAVIILTGLPDVSAPLGRPILHKPLEPDRLVAMVERLVPIDREIGREPTEAWDEAPTVPSHRSPFDD
jgi:DNA-binding response OmpR family regulator